MGAKKYLTSNDVCEIFDITKRTLGRWEKETPYGRPFPAPALGSKGGSLKRYLTSEVIAWEEKCIQNNKQLTQ